MRLSPGRGWSSSKSPSTDAKVNYLVIRYLYFRSVRGGLDLSSSSTSAKVNRLVIRFLHFWSVLGDLQEGLDYASRCQSLSFRAQNRGFCALLPFETPVFGHFEHKIEVFVRFCPSKPSFSGISSTKSGFLCAFALWNPRFRAVRAQKTKICARVAVKCSIGKSNSRLFEILPGEGWHKAPLAVKSSVMIGWIGDKLLD